MPIRSKKNDKFLVGQKLYVVEPIVHCKWYQNSYFAEFPVSMLQVDGLGKQHMWS